MQNILKMQSDHSIIQPQGVVLNQFDFYPDHSLFCKFKVICVNISKAEKNASSITVPHIFVCCISNISVFVETSSCKTHYGISQ
jgi:hypothetical protein